MRLALHRHVTPDQIALGVGIGLFCGLVLPPGVHIFSAIAIAQLARASVPAAMLATLVSNPLTLPFLYPLAALVGSWFTGIPLRTEAPETPESLWQLFAEPALHGRTLMLICLGNLVIGSVVSVIGYHAAKLWAVRRHARRIAKAHKKAAAPKEK